MLLEALVRAEGLTPEPVAHRDLSDIAGSWRDDPEIEGALGDQRVIHEEMWR